VAVAIAGPDDLSSGVRWGTLLCVAWLVGCGRIGFDAEDPPGMCEGPGTCAPILMMPGVCNDLVVCGCDGRQYPTPCDAERAGVSIAAIGPCTI
jgi:hypothetical protein